MNPCILNIFESISWTKSASFTSLNERIIGSLFYQSFYQIFLYSKGAEVKVKKSKDYYMYKWQFYIRFFLMLWSWLFGFSGRLIVFYMNIFINFFYLFEILRRPFPSRKSAGCKPYGSLSALSPGETRPERSRQRQDYKSHQLGLQKGKSGFQKVYRKVLLELKELVVYSEK